MNIKESPIIYSTGPEMDHRVMAKIGLDPRAFHSGEIVWQGMTQAEIDGQINASWEQSDQEVLEELDGYLLDDENDINWEHGISFNSQKFTTERDILEEKYKVLIPLRMLEHGEKEVSLPEELEEIPPAVDESVIRKIDQENASANQ